MANITSNPFPLGLVTGAAGTPIQLSKFFPDSDATVNALIVQAWPKNKGNCYLGNAQINPVTGAGIIHWFTSAGETFTFSSYSMNVFDLSQLYLWSDSAGDGALVSVYVR